MLKREQSGHHFADDISNSFSWLKFIAWIMTACMSNYMWQFYVDVITYSCPELNADLNNLC